MKVRHQPATRVGLLICLIVFMLFAIASFDNFQVGAFADDATYIVLARSLARGLGYTLSNFPQPVREMTFPPGYPLMLTPLVYLWPNSFVPLKLLSLLATFVTIVFLFKVAIDKSKITFGTPALGSVIGLYAIHPWVVGASGMVMSEAVYTCMTFITILLVWHYERKDQRVVLWAIFVAVMLVITSLIRTVGIALTIASFLYLGVVQRKPRHLVALVMAWILSYSPVYLFNRNSGGGYYRQDI